MAATEEILRAITQAALHQIQRNPDVLDSILWELPGPRLTQVKSFLAAQPITIQDAWTTTPQVTPSVIILPGESEETQQFVGGIGGVTDFLTAPTGQATTIGSMFVSTHAVICRSPNALMTIAVAKAILWALAVARRGGFLDRYNIVETKLAESPLMIEELAGGPQEAAVTIYRRSVHLTHTWQLTYDFTIAGPLLVGVAATLTDNDSEGASA